jgi:N-acyl amino acid synthase of PEP-CTERM/exosortase system
MHVVTAGGETIPQLDRIPSPEAKKDFEIVPAFSDALKDEVFRIRHQVYCEELAFEPRRQDQRERDEYDAHSLHLLLRSVHSREFIACTRIVRTRPEDPYYPLPFEKSCAATLDRSIVDPAKLPRGSIGEVSRLAVLARFRNRQVEERRNAGFMRKFGSQMHPRLPYILADLYLGTIELARLYGIDTLFVLTERRLSRHLRMLGVKIQAIGTPIEHCGQRLPSMMSATGIIDNLKLIVRPLYRTIAAEVAQGCTRPLVGLGVSAALQH